MVSGGGGLQKWENRGFETVFFFWGGGGSDVACRILKTALSHVIVARNWAQSLVDYQKLPCRMSLRILGPMSPVEFKKRPCHLSLGSTCHLLLLRMPHVALSNLRNDRVALSILILDPSVYL